MTTLLLVAGDSSGDQHAAEFVRAFRERDSGARFVGMAGARMESAGVEVAVPQSVLAVSGFSAVASSAVSIVRAWNAMGRVLKEVQPDLAVLVDSGGFNLPLARRIRRVGDIPILYYVAPQVWAWRRSRIRKLATRVDRLAVILPFEAEVYAGQPVRVDYVGHPLLDRLSSFPVSGRRERARRELGVPDAGPLIALFPGSRRNEVAYHLPLQLQTASWIFERSPEVRYVLALASSIDVAFVESILARNPLPPGLDLRFVEDRSWEALAAADAALVKPGTVTLEAALLGCPMVVMGRAGRATAALLRRFVQVPYLSMPNLLASEALVPELYQEDARPDRIGECLVGLLSGPGRDRQRVGFERIRESLGKPGAAQRVAQIAEEMIGSSAS